MSIAGSLPCWPSWTRADPVTPASRNANSPSRWQNGSVHIRCVIVDDDPAFLTVARTLLERDGLVVAGVAHNRAEAARAASALQPDVVLIDIRLGDESGFDVARMLAGAGEPTALIMISTHSAADYADLIAESPAAGFLPKAELSAAAVRRILGTD